MHIFCSILYSSFEYLYFTTLRIVLSISKGQYNIIPKENKWKYTNMNPMATNLHATIKLHKQNTPIRPITNWRNAPAYKLANLSNKKHHTTAYSYPTHIQPSKLHTFDY
jgi:hypothetical protein